MPKYRALKPCTHPDSLSYVEKGEVIETKAQVKAPHLDPVKDVKVTKEPPKPKGKKKDPSEPQPLSDLTFE